MIRNQWYAVLESREVKKGRVTGALRMGEKLAFWREPDGKINCIADKCPHRGASLSAGKLHNGHPQCPFHGLEFDANGKCILIPANGKNALVPTNFRVKSYTAAETGGLIWIFWGDKTPAPSSPPFFSDLEEGFTWRTCKDPWKCHYSRCIENQLDVVHLPFVHRTTIGKGNKTLVSGPVTVTESDELNVWVYNTADNGQKPLRAEDLPPPDCSRQHLHFRFPHIWQNWLTDKIRIFIAFVPVDSGNTILYMRFCQKFLRFPGLAFLVNTAGILMSLIIAHQDRRVVHTQIPAASELKMDENLLAGDKPIIEYRMRRDYLKKRTE